MGHFRSVIHRTSEEIYGVRVAVGNKLHFLLLGLWNMFKCKIKTNVVSKEIKLCLHLEYSTTIFTLW